MDCTNCGAPLQPKSNLCTYCDTLNDTDLRAIRRNATRKGEADRDCPRCAERMTSIDMRLSGGLLVERCKNCLGIFFDPGELEQVLDDSVSHVYEIDVERMNTIVAEEVNTDMPVKYLPCPACGALMHRKSYGRRAGVIVDRCREHGIWLDGGELGTLFKWAKAGGQLHHDRREEDEQRHERDLVQMEQFKMIERMSEGEQAAEGSRLSGVLGALIRMLD
jgi:Zn-finger nucleic acid-binding protein